MAPRPVEAPKHLPLVTAVALLAFSVLPLELGLGKVGLGAPLAVVLAFLALRYRQPGAKGGAVQAAAVLLGVWVGIRLTLVAYLNGEPVALGLMGRELTALVVGVAIYRMAQQERLRPAIVRGVVLCAALLLLNEAYQMVVGLPRLLGAGYGAETGFFFFTQSGQFRPFGTFAGPTTFGTYLAMVGIFAALALRNRAGLLLGVLTVVGVVLTETRAAYIGLAVALVVMVLSSAELRRRSAGVVIFGPLLLALAVIYRPDSFSTIVTRSLSATDAGDSSRSTRLALWQGVMDATSQHGATWIGLGDANWQQLMFPQVGDLVLTLGHAHSNFFQEWFRYGVIGAALFVVLVLALLRSTVSGLRQGSRYGVAATGAVIVFLADSVFNNSLSSINFVLAVFLVAGMGAPAIQAPITRGRHERAALHRSDGRVDGGAGAKDPHVGSATG